MKSRPSKKPHEKAKKSDRRDYMRNLREYLAHIGVQMYYDNGHTLRYADAEGSPPKIKGDITFGKLMAALKLWPQLKDVVSRTTLLAIDVPGGEKIYPRE